MIKKLVFIFIILLVEWSEWTGAGLKKSKRDDEFRPPTLDGKIIGGENVKIQDYAYQVSLEYFGNHICEASIVHRKWCITAAHCVHGKLHEELSIRANSTVKEYGGKVFRVCNVVHHRKYIPATYEYDLALLQLCHPMKIGSGQHWIRIIEKEPKLATAVFATGWNMTSKGGHTHLQRVELNIVSKGRCRETYGRVIPRSMLCAVPKNLNSCFGSPGGPLVVEGYQVGVLSWGIACTRTGYPTIYSSIAHTHAWSLQTILEKNATG